MCDKKNSILSTDTECVILSHDFKLLDENHVLLRVPRKDNMYSVDLKNIVPSGGLTCLFAKATLDESNLWHRRLGHINFKTINKLVKGNLVRGLPLNLFEINQTFSLLVRRESNTEPLTQTKSMNYEPVVAGNQSNGIADTKACENAVSKDSPDAGFKPSREEEKKDAEHLENEDSEVPNTEEPRVNQEQDESVNSTNNINTVSSTVNTASIEDNAVDENIVYGCVDDPNMPNLEEIVYSDDDEDVDAEADMTNLDTHILVSPTPTTRIHKDHPLEQIIGDIHSAPQTRRMTKSVTDHVEPKKVIQALTDPSWIEAMQDELLQFKLQKVWTLVDLPYGKRAIGTKWIYRNKKDERDLNEEVYVLSTSRVEDSSFPNIVYKVEKDTIWTTSALRAGKKSLSTEYWIIYCPRGLQVTHKHDGIFISQDKYVDEILKKFGFSTVKTASTPMETSKPLMKDGNAEDVDVHLYRSMIGSLMYLTSSRPDIMFVYPKDSPFDLEAYTDNDYAGASLDRKSTTRGCQFLRRRLISWQCKKQTVVANSTTEAEYVVASSCCGQYATPSHTKKVFANIRRQGKDFSGTVTPLFATMLIQHQADVSKGSGQPTEPQHTPTTTSPSNIESIPIIASSSQPQKTHKCRKTKRPTKISQSSGPTTLVADETVHKERGDSMERAATTTASLDAEQDNVPQPRNMTIIETKWVFRNKLDENGIVSRNKARLVAQGYNQQEGIVYDETYALVARLESIRILLAYACALDFKLFQMDVKSAFLNGFINEEGACVFTDKWSLDELAYGVPRDGPYQNNLPSPDDIISYVRNGREGKVTRTRHRQKIDVQDYQILTREILTTMKPLEEIIQENVFCLGGNRDHVPSLELFNESYILYDRVMNPLTAQQEQKTIKDCGMRRGRHSTSSSSAFDQPSSSHLNDDDDNDDENDKGTSHASTPSPTRFVNSLTNEVPQVF
ncbi:putative ribonuclease H-like domain-containing protein [Tanacetum coccineum]